MFNYKVVSAKGNNTLSVHTLVKEGLSFRQAKRLAETDSSYKVRFMAVVY